MSPKADDRSGPHKSLPTNPLLADPMYWNGYIEKVGTGTEDIISKCHDYGLKTPEFHQEEDFRVVIWRNEAPNVATDIEAASTVTRDVPLKSDIELSDRQQVILSVLRNNVPLNVPLNTVALSQKLKVTRKTIQRELDALQKLGIVSRAGGRKFGYWVINED